jgi:hypothetical protein
MATEFVQSLLAQDETVVANARQHWMALLRFALQPIVILGAALVCFAIGSWINPGGDGLINDLIRFFDTLLGLVTLGLFIVAAVWIPVQILRWTQRRYVLTNRRVLHSDGLLRRSSIEAALTQITDVGFRETFIGRYFGYADLSVVTASGEPLRFRQMVDGLEFKKQIMNAQEALIRARAGQILTSEGQSLAASIVTQGATPAVAPTAPAPPTTATVPAAAATVPPPAAAAPATPATMSSATPPPSAVDESGWDAVAEPVAGAPVAAPSVASPAAPGIEVERAESVEDITQTLASLAQLRDQGVISAEDYEEKKQDLLGRL